MYNCLNIFKCVSLNVIYSYIFWDVYSKRNMSFINERDVKIVLVLICFIYIYREEKLIYFLFIKGLKVKVNKIIKYMCCL